MKYVLASKKQRVLSFLIDGVLVGGLGFLFGWLIVRFSGLSAYYTSCYNEYQTAVSAGTAGNSDIIKPLLAMLAKSGVYAGIYFILTWCYLILLPLCVEWQTLGRLIMKCRLMVCKKDIKPTFKSLVLRELVGEYLLYMVITLFLKAWNLVLWLSMVYALMSGWSFPDRIGHLKLVNKDPEEDTPFIDDFEVPEGYEFGDESGILDASTFEKKEKEEPEKENVGSDDGEGINH